MKKILTIIVICVVLYVVLAFAHVLPDSVNVLARKNAQPAVEQTENKVVAAEKDQQTAQEESAQEKTEKPSILDIAMSIQGNMLRNGKSLKQFVEFKNSDVAPNKIIWNFSGDAMNPDLYNISIRLPGKTEGEMVVAYQFTYNYETKEITPVDDAARALISEGSVPVVTKVVTE